MFVKAFQIYYIKLLRNNIHDFLSIGAGFKFFWSLPSYELVCYELVNLGGLFTGQRFSVQFDVGVSAGPVQRLAEL